MKQAFHQEVDHEKNQTLDSYQGRVVSLLYCSYPLTDFSTQTWVAFVFVSLYFPYFLSVRKLIFITQFYDKRCQLFSNHFWTMRTIAQRLMSWTSVANYVKQWGSQNFPLPVRHSPNSVPTDYPWRAVLHPVSHSVRWNILCEHQLFQMTGNLSKAPREPICRNVVYLSITLLGYIPGLGSMRIVVKFEIITSITGFLEC